MSDFDFVIDQDDAYAPEELPSGAVRMDGRMYPVRCPKDSLSVFLARLQRRAAESEDPQAEEDLIRELLLSTFMEEDVEELLERVLDQRDRMFTLAFLMDTVRRVQREYEPYLTKQFEAMGLENPMSEDAGQQRQVVGGPTRQPLPPAQRSTSRKPAAKKTATKKTTARR